MKIALIYPPTADPTAPYLSVPLLTGYLRHHWVEVLPIDANVEAYETMLKRDYLEKLRDRLKKRMKILQRKKYLAHTDQLEYLNLTWALEITPAVINQIDESVDVLKGKVPQAFFDPVKYEKALCTVEGALEMISANCFPMELDFLKYKTPFGLLDIQEIKNDAAFDKNPFYEYYETLCQRLDNQELDIIGISVAFTAQIQPAYSLAYQIRNRFKDMPLVIGGPAITQVFSRFSKEKANRAKGPFDAVVLFEGEITLLEIVKNLEQGKKPVGIINGKPVKDLATLPAPDFEGLFPDKYLSPELVLPYDTSRGCYWGKCTFCHYGLAEKGTAPYRQRPAQKIAHHLKAINDKYKNPVFYFSQDTIAPKFALQLANLFSTSKVCFKWASDMRAEAYLTPEVCQDLAKGGVLALSLGVESGSGRVLSLINKGIDLKTIQSAIPHLADAGIAVECMCFTDFPSETYSEAMDTIRFLNQIQHKMALFICGSFELVPGAYIAEHFQDFGISRIWTIKGDDFVQKLFYVEKTIKKSPAELEKIDMAVENLAIRFWLHKYPWAGSLSTAHTLLWYNHHGKDIFRKTGRKRDSRRYRLPIKQLKNQTYDIDEIAQIAYQREAQIWQKMIENHGSISRGKYSAMAAKYPPIHGVITKSRKT